MARKPRRRRRKPPSADEFLEKGLNEIVEALGLGILGLGEDELREALRGPVSMVLGASKPKLEVLIKRLRRNLGRVYSMIAGYILENRDRLSEEQLEFVVSYGNEVLAAHVPRLYREIMEKGRSDLLPLLREAWERHGKPTPLRCPRCGFRAVSPDLTCMVCGLQISEEEARRQLGFDELLELLAEEGDIGMIREIAEEEEVYVTRTGLWPPRLAPREEPGVLIRLRRDEVRRLRERLKNEEGVKH